MAEISRRRVSRLLQNCKRSRILVVGDCMLDQFIWGRVQRISPEAPVPIVEFISESFMPGGAANVARNLAALGAPNELFSILGRDPAGKHLRHLLEERGVQCQGLVSSPDRSTSIKSRIIAHQQQVVRVDREQPDAIASSTIKQLLRRIISRLPHADAVILGDYGKGVVCQELLDEIRTVCRTSGIWLSLDPKPVHRLNLAGLSLITPNRKEAFALAGLEENHPHADPLQDKPLLETAETLLSSLRPAILLITLGDQGMLLCQRDHPPFHIPTAAQEVFDVSGAGDTVIASITLAIASGASPVEAAVFCNHVAGIVVGKVGTATATPQEVKASFHP